MTPRVKEALERMRNNATLCRIITDLESKGWTINLTEDHFIYCSHPHVDQPMHVIEAHAISRHMGEFKNG
jgi:hypothetical protein